MSLNYIQRISLCIISFLFAFLLDLQAQDTAAGKNLFKANCAACHNKDMKSNMTGPALGGVEERWAEYPKEDLYAWIRNSQKQISEGHPMATQLWDEWGEKGGQMTSFPALKDDDIANMLAYIQQEFTKVPEAVETVTSTGGQSKQKSNFIYYLLLGVLAIVALVLSRVISGLNYIQDVKELGPNAKQRTLWDALTNKGFVALLLVGLMTFLGYQVVNRAMNLGRQQGYAPTQPIKFSHKVHAGDQQIDCKYCHDGARRSKHSVIPAANTCMNCHTAVTSGTTTGTAEISKIYASVGFDPVAGKYIEDYENMEEDKIEEIYKAWIGAKYMEDNDLASLDAKGERIVREQWRGIKNSLTNKQKTKIQGGIEWIRVHNLPDHVYFNHAQHVTVGKLECQTCHGPVQEMEVLEQSAPLSMGWCINCHRQTEVKGFADNKYYAESYIKMHEEMVNGTRKSVTVEEIGGTECQKCHY